GRGRPRNAPRVAPSPNQRDRGRAPRPAPGRYSLLRSTSYLELAHLHPVHDDELGHHCEKTDREQRRDPIEPGLMAAAADECQYTEQCATDRDHDSSGECTDGRRPQRSSSAASTVIVEAPEAATATSASAGSARFARLCASSAPPRCVP